MRDFTLTMYKTLLSSLKSQGYNFQTFAEYLKNPIDKVVICRHDVDLLPLNSLATAKVEHSLGIKGTYFFRTTKQVFIPSIIKEIESLGHEIGYHYEEMDLVNGDLEKGIALFSDSLQRFREFCTVETICMHGSPLSKFDNKLLWTKYNYRNYGIIGEPYYDIDFTKFLYLTDTGRKWNGSDVSVRDKVVSSYNFVFKRTPDILNSLSLLPDKIMITFHPQRWTNDPILWYKELFFQSLKNILKKYILVNRG